MGWKARPKATVRFEHPGGRIGASAGEGEGLSAEQLEPLIDAAISRHRELGTLRDENEAAAFRRYMCADLTGGAEALAQREAELREAMAQRADANGDMRASGRPADGEQLVASAIKAGRIRAMGGPGLEPGTSCL